MLLFFWTSRKLASSCPTPVRHKQVCVVQHYFLGSYLKPLSTVSTHISPSPCGAQLFHGNQRPDPFHTCMQVSGGQKDPGITALVQPQQISELSACQHYLASRMETEAHSSHYSASGDTDTQAASESLLYSPTKDFRAANPFSIGYGFNKPLFSALLPSLPPSFSVSSLVSFSFTPIQQEISTYFLFFLSAALFPSRFMLSFVFPPFLPSPILFPLNSSLLHFNTSVFNLRHQLETITPFHFKNLNVKGSSKAKQFNKFDTMLGTKTFCSLCFVTEAQAPY